MYIHINYIYKLYTRPSRDPVCGSDGLNYGNQCEMQQAACRANMSIVEVDASNCDNGKATFHVLTASVVNSCKFAKLNVKV